MNWHALGQQKQIELCVLLSRRNVATSSGMWTLLNHKGRDQGSASAQQPSCTCSTPGAERLLLQVLSAA